MVQDQHFNGIIMYRQNYREQDLLVKVLTEHAGKRMFFLKRARQTNFPLASALLPFTTATYEGKLNLTGLSFINTARNVTNYPQLLADIKLNAYTTYIMSLLDAAYEDRISIPKWYNQLKVVLGKLNAGIDPQVIAQIIAIQMLEPFGVKPSLSACVSCQQTQITMDFSPRHNGMLCQNHWALDEHRLHLSPRAVYYLQHFQTLDLTRINSITMKQGTKDELQRFIDERYTNAVGIQLKAKSFIDQMDSWQQASQTLIAKRRHLQDN
ncbi:DNA repair protein RecO [Periweissella beninensis]|uniref:DNA repair protein RecO n=1 Tax=Periweissella beninensis TaxID=504936 RepID=A0ABT0VIT7_9LACO|nr:DNA repair protein RecO [Periweissella beninensis]MCM2436779.1 DNA repair protein RecO [Periweissella beninensis]MCT4395514.1 DNA repair protein RecO [Periweissella beninensis]